MPLSINISYWTSTQLHRKSL